MSAKRKNIDTWFYSVDDLMAKQVPREGEPEEVDEVERVGERKVEIHVYMVKDTEEDKTPPHTLKTVTFQIECKNPKFCFEGTDISILKDMAWAAIDERYKIQWFVYYLVRVVASRIYDGEGEGIEFFYKTVEKGITWEGKELLREYVGYRVDYKIKSWPGKFTDKDGVVMACIPGSDANLEALKKFGEKIALMRTALAQFLKPENILATLGDISGFKLLPGVEQAVLKEEQAKAEAVDKA